MISEIWFVTSAIFSGFLAVYLTNLTIQFLKRRHKALQWQGEELDRYYDLTARFLKETDPKEYDESRQALVSLALGIQNGLLAKIMLRAMIEVDRTEALPSSNSKISRQLSTLNKSNEDIFAQAVAHALLASTVALPFSGHAVRAGIMAMVDRSTPSVDDPEQIVVSFQKSKVKRPIKQHWVN